jgi:tetratricopeptide (TPR) repeat protein
MPGYSREAQALAAYNKSFEYLRTGNQSAAIDVLNEAVSLLKLLVIEDGRLDLAKKLAIALSNEASVQFSSEVKLKLYEEMIQLLRTLVVSKGVQDVADSYAGALANKGKLHAELAGLAKRFKTKGFELHYDLFVRLFEEAVEACEKYVPEAFKSSQHGLVLMDRAMGWKELGEGAKAKVDAEQALELVTMANNAQPTDRTQGALEYVKAMSKYV